MRNLAKARVQVLENVTPKPAALPQPSLPAASDALGTTAKQASQLPALPTSAEKVSIILNKSAVDAMENIAEMAILQSEKVALQEMVTANKLPGNKQVSYIEDLPVKGPKYNPCPDPSPYAKNAVEIIENNNQFVWNEPEAKWLSPSGKRKIWYDNGWKYEGENGIVEEFTVLEKYSMCKTTYKTSTTGNGSFMNGHHGIQSDWAETRINEFSRKLKLNDMYNPNEAPVILLRDTYDGSPHRYITNKQTQRKLEINQTDYIDQRDYTFKELTDIGCSKNQVEKYLSESDEYFKSIFEKLKEEIKKSNYSEKEIFSEELQDIFGNYFQ